MNDITTWALDETLTASRFRAEPLPYVGEAPCMRCEHAQRCARESLACCAFTAYLQRTDIRRRSEHREPSAEWWDYAEHLEQPGIKPPACAQCRNTPRRAPVEHARTARGETQAKITVVLAQQPGLITPEIAQRVGVTERAARSALRTMLSRGMVEISGVETTTRKSEMKRYRIRDIAVLDRVTALISQRPGLRAFEVGEALGMSWQDALGRLEMLQALGRVEPREVRKGVRVWRVCGG